MKQYMEMQYKKRNVYFFYYTLSYEQSVGFTNLKKNITPYQFLVNRV